MFWKFMTIALAILNGYLTYEQIAEEFELSVRQTKTIIYKEEQRLIKHI